MGLPEEEYANNIIQEPCAFGFLLQKAFAEAWDYAGMPKQVLHIEKVLVLGHTASNSGKQFIDYLLTNS